jgi:hypothetical protein
MMVALMPGAGRRNLGQLVIGDGFPERLGLPLSWHWAAVRTDQALCLDWCLIGENVICATAASRRAAYRCGQPAEKAAVESEAESEAKPGMNSEVRAVTRPAMRPAMK